jgi:flagellar biosynthesis GTPase FlhF
VALGNMPSFDDVMESQIFRSTAANQADSPMPMDFAAELVDSFTDDSNLLFKEELDRQALLEQNTENNRIAEDRDNLKAREIVDLVKQELAAMRNEFKLAQQLDAWSGTHSVADEMRPLVEAFNETGMPIGLRALATDIINQSVDMTEALTAIAEALGSSVNSIDLLDNMQGIHVIAGSSGSGKTLMAGRLAKQAALNYGEHQVAIISFNDGRFGAWNQSQLVGSQAGVETFRTNSPEMLEQLLQELDSRKLIIIDTPGEDVEAHSSSLLKLLPDAQPHLVVAADASEASVKRYIRPEGIEWSSVMLSRLETGVYPWALINTLLNRDTPVSVAAAEPSIIDPATTITGHALAQHALAHLPISFV